MGVPPAAEQETSEVAATLCLNLFEAMGVHGITMMDIDTALRVPTRRRSSERTENETSRPNPVVCIRKFTRRLAKEKVLAKRNEVNNVTCRDLGMSSDSDATISHLAVNDHLTPRLQELLFEAKKFQTCHKYEFCWAQGSTIPLRASSDSRVIKLNTMTVLENLTRRETR